MPIRPFDLISSRLRRAQLIEATLLLLGITAAEVCLAARLGFMTVRSAQGQPFDAEVAVVDGDDASGRTQVKAVEPLRIRLAGRDELLWPMVWLDRSRPGNIVVRVRTEYEITEVAFELTLVIESDRGRMVVTYPVALGRAGQSTSGRGERVRGIVALDDMATASVPRTRPTGAVDPIVDLLRNDGQPAPAGASGVNNTSQRLAQDAKLAATEVESQRLQLAESRLSTELQAERKKRQELEAQLSAAKSESIRPPTPTQAASAPRNPHALIIGNAAYPGSSRLDNPVNDANAVSQKLRGMGFTVTVITDANRQRLVQALAQFRKSASEADLSLLYYSGHGVQISGTNYILPTDVDQSDPAQATIQGVSLNSVVESFMPGRTKLVFLDACRDNPLQRTGDRSVSRGLAPVSAAQGTLISYATKDGQTASDGTGSKNSPFTQALLEHLSDPVDIAVVLRKVREKVMKATGGKQQPWEYGSLTGGELILSAIKR